jgi:hypothetical protein
MLQSNQTARSHRSSLQLWSPSMLNKHLHLQIFSPTARQTCLRHGDKHQNVANYELISVNPCIPVLCFESLHPGTSRKTVSLIFMVPKMSEFHHLPIIHFTTTHPSPNLPYFTIIHPSFTHQPIIYHETTMVISLFSSLCVRRRSSAPEACLAGWGAPVAPPRSCVLRWRKRSVGTCG